MTHTNRAGGHEEDSNKKPRSHTVFAQHLTLLLLHTDKITRYNYTENK